MMFFLADYFVLNFHNKWFFKNQWKTKYFQQPNILWNKSYLFSSYFKGFGNWNCKWRFSPNLQHRIFFIIIHISKHYHLLLFYVQGLWFLAYVIPFAYWIPVHFYPYYMSCEPYSSTSEFYCLYYLRLKGKSLTIVLHWPGFQDIINKILYIVKLIKRSYRVALQLAFQLRKSYEILYWNGFHEVNFSASTSPYSFSSLWWCGTL